MFRNGRSLVRVKPQIQRMQDSAGGGHAEKGFEVTSVVPHHGRDAIARPQTKLGQRGGETARPAIEIAIVGAHNGAVRAARDDLDLRKQFSRALQHRRKGQRIIHHRAAHRGLSGTKQAESYHQ